MAAPRKTPLRKEEVGCVATTSDVASACVKYGASPFLQAAHPRACPLGKPLLRMQLLMAP